MTSVRPARWLSGATALVVITVGAGCSSGTSISEPSSTTSPVVAATAAPVVTTLAPAPSVDATATTAPAAPAVPATTPVDPAATTAPVAAPAAPSTDGAALLSAAVAAMSPGYHFDTTLTVNGAVALTADGDKVGDGTRVGVTQGEESVQYVITPAGSWVQPQGGDWQQLDSGTGTIDPVAALAAPSSVQVTGTDGTATLVSAAVPATQLGLVDGPAVTLSARIDNGAITSVGYSTTVDDEPATMVASIGPVVNGSPVVAPV
ncbi:MAG: hypothetical protein JWM34_522 [Ilumatobacteraceae bacterium]|nr:hypothetical protein [Ilumatobacteraceae bacterium]